jgi:hypothetical protein
MRKFITYLLSAALFAPAIAQEDSGTSEKLWFDGNARVMYDRDAINGDLANTDTISARNDGGGFTILDLGFHFTPVEDVEIYSQVRLRNDFGGMWGARSAVDLRWLSAKGVINDKISYNVGDIHLRQTNFTLHNYGQEISKYEPEIFNFYRDYVDYENFYKEDYWRLQGLQTNFSYAMYNSIKSLDFDAFTARVRGAQWLGQPELLMLGGTAMANFSDGLRAGIHYINTFEIIASSNGTDSYYNPVFNAQLGYKGKWNEMPFDAMLEGGASQRGWTGDSLASEISGFFTKASVKLTAKKAKFNASFRAVDTDFRSIGAQTRRINYISSPDTYPFYGNDYIVRRVSMLDIVSDPSVYNQYLSTSLMDYNAMYSAVNPYGDATPNRIGMTAEMSDWKASDKFSVSAHAQAFTELIGQGTLEKRMLARAGLHSTLDLGKLQAETSLIFESVQRGGSDFESIDFGSNLYSGSISYEVIRGLKVLAGAKMFVAQGNEVTAERDEYDQVNDYEIVNYDAQETMLIAGVQHNFTEDVYFTLQYNQFDIDDFSMGRLIFMFRVNL